MKRIFSVLLAFCLIFLCACGNNNGIQDYESSAPQDLNEDAEAEIIETTNPEQTTVPLTDEMIYSAFLSALCEDLRDIIVDDTYLDGFDSREGMIGVAEIAMHGGKDMLKKIGYTIKDINDDGIKELLLFQVDDLNEEVCIGTRILCAYTVSGSEKVLLFEGHSRNSYYILDDASVYNEGSNGAAYTGFGIYRYEGGVFSCVDFFFTDLDENMKPLLLHNITGEWNVAASETFDGDEAAFWETQADFTARIQSVDLYTLESYEG